MEIWDKGTYELVEEKKDGGLTVRLHGERLKGTYALVPAKLSGDPKNWLILRKKDDAEPAAQTTRNYRPMLATPAEDVPHGDWLYEIKWDGYRIMATVAGSDASLRTRKDQDYTKRFENVAKELVKAVKTPDCVVDGEVCALDGDGRPSFSAMQQGKPGTPIVYFVFDLLEVDGEPLIDLPLEERRKRLEKLLDKRNRTVRYSETFEDGDALLEAANQQGLEGILAKRLGSKYLPGRRSREWLKIKGHGRQEFVIAGYTRGQGRRQGTLGSLVLATYEGGDLVYVGNVGTGFSDREIDRLVSKLKPLQRDTTPFKEAPKMPRIRKGDVVWVEPKLVAEVEFVEWTHDGHLRAPAYKGLREDKEAAEVRREEPEPFPAEIRKGKRVFKPSNVDKLFWPDEGIAKGDLLSYYHRVAPVLIPHLKSRPFTMKRYPDGWQGKFFFQKDAPKGMPDWIPTASIAVTTRDKPRQRRRIDAPLVNDELALLWMVNMGCIDLNAWYSRIDKPERPDWVLFDLDPSPDVGFPETIEVALLVKQALETLELRERRQDERVRGHPRPRPDRAPAHVRGHARVLGDRRQRARAHAPRARHDGVDEGEAPRRADRLEPERRGEDDRVRLLGAAESRRAGLDPAALGRGRRVTRPGRVHDGRGAPPGRAARRPVRGRADDEAVVDRCVEDAALEVVVGQPLGARVALVDQPVVLHVLVVRRLVRYLVGVVANLLELAVGRSHRRSASPRTLSGPSLPPFEVLRW